MSLTVETHELVTEAIEAECRTVMAMRVGLKLIPGTHAKQAAMLAECDDLLDQWLAMQCDGETH